MGRRIKLGPVLIGGEVVLCSLESVLRILVWLATLRISSRSELGWAKTLPNGDGGRRRMSQISGTRTLERVIVNRTQHGVSAKRLFPREDSTPGGKAFTTSRKD